MKIAIEIKADGDFCGMCRFLKKPKLFFVYDEPVYEKPLCSMFRVKGGYERRLRMNKTKPIRCQQCIDAEIGDDK